MGFLGEGIAEGVMVPPFPEPLLIREAFPAVAIDIVLARAAIDPRVHR
jgi:hypothetical protein